MPTLALGRVAVVASLMVAACSGDTAIVLSIHTADPGVATSTRLDVYVGVGVATPPTSTNASVVTPAWWHRAPLELGADALVFPDGLGDQVYELALYPSGGLELGDDVMFAVAATAPSDADQLLGFAHATQPLRFGAGEIRRVDVPLIELSDRTTAGVTTTGCAWWRAEPSDPIPSRVRDRAIVPADDADCDAFVAPAPGTAAPDCQPEAAIDCDDTRPEVFPDASAGAQDCSATDTDCCSTTVANLEDNDMDSWKKCAGDCQDDVGVADLFGVVVPPDMINPGQTDTNCNGVDEACAVPRGGKCDPTALDPDGDRFVTCQGAATQVGAVDITSCTQYRGQTDCLEVGAVTGIGNDPQEMRTVEAAEIHPAAEDVECDGVDQDCSRHCDDGAEGDADADGFARCARAGTAPPDSVQCALATDAPDCDDDDFFGRPRPQVEACDGFDSNCDGVLDTSSGAVLCLPPVSAGGCQLGTRTCTEQANGQPSSICEPGGPLLPTILCAQCAGGGDPLNCVTGVSPVCTAHTPTAAPGAACIDPAQDAPLPPCPTGTCAWSLVGTQPQAGWRVGLVDPTTPGSTPGPMVTGATAALRVVGVGPAPQGFIVRRMSAGGDVFHHVVFRPGAGCTALTCTGG